MKKYNLFYLVLLACMFLTSCGGSETKITGKGIFGDIPGYLLQYCDLSKQCADELEFEDNVSKQGEIINKYQEQWAKYVEDSKISDFIFKSSNREIPVVASEEYGISSAHLSVENLDIRIDEKTKRPKLMLQMKYGGNSPSGNICALLNDNDSVIMVGSFKCDFRHNAEVVFTLNNLNPKKSKDRDVTKVVLYALDKVVKIKVVPKEESIATLESCVRNIDALMKMLHEAGVVESISFTGENALNGEAQAEEKEKKEEVDKTKPGLVDLAYFGLRGPVQNFTEYCDGTRVFTYRFSENGKWEARDGKKLSGFLSDVKRDSEKRIIGYQIEENYAIYNYTISYDANTGWVSKIACDGSDENKVTTFSYDKNGYVVKEVADGTYTEEGVDEPTKEHLVTTYKYESFDEYGNWTKRTVKQSNGGTWNEKRVFGYYRQ